jgi:hypothetical protein
MPLNMLVRLGVVLYRLSVRESVPEIQYMNGQPPVVFQGASEVKNIPLLLRTGKGDLVPLKTKKENNFQ